MIRTPWGELRPLVDLLPVWYLQVLYGTVWFLPFGVFETWRKGEDGSAEWLQFLAYAACSFVAFVGWLTLALSCLIVTGEEICWGELIFDWGLDLIRGINNHNETNIHNLHGSGEFDAFRIHILRPAFRLVRLAPLCLDRCPAGASLQPLFSARCSFLQLASDIISLLDHPRPAHSQ